MLEQRVAAIERRRPAGTVDALGAPLDAGSWPMLREALKATISEIGVPEAARRYGASPETFKSVVYRREMPGLGARARLASVVQFRPRAQIEASDEPPALTQQRVLALPYLGRE